MPGLESERLMDENIFSGIFVCRKESDGSGNFVRFCGRIDISVVDEKRYEKSERISSHTSSPWAHNNIETYVSYQSINVQDPTRSSRELICFCYPNRIYHIVAEAALDVEYCQPASADRDGFVSRQRE